MPKKKKPEEKPTEEPINDKLTKNDVGEEPKQRKRTRKDVPVFVLADELQMKAIYYIGLFGVPDPPVFTNVIETGFEVEECAGQRILR